MSDGDFIKIYRSLLNWEWYSDINTTRVFLHMLLKANWKDSKFLGNVIPRGSFVSSIGKLAEETSLTIQEVRTAISHLKSTNEITSKSTSKYTVFIINNYDLFQSVNIQNNNQSTNEQQTNNKQSTTSEEKKEKKKERKKQTMCNEDVAIFERIWSLYPVKRGKGQISDTNKRHILDIGFDEMERTINRYKADLVKDSWRKPQNGSTFFNGGYVDYLDEEYYKNHPNEKREMPEQGTVVSIEVSNKTTEEGIDWENLSDEQWIAYMEQLAKEGKI